MTRLIKIAGWENGARLNVVFVHGLGGHAYDTWRQRADDGTFWPVWLSRDIPGVATWTLAYDAPPSNWLGTAMPIQDRAKNVLECLLGQRDLRGVPTVFVCHSLGGLVVKQVLRAADARRAYGDAEAKTFVDDVKGVVFIATPHTGSMQATLLDKLRLIAWPSASTLDLVRNSANLRDLNVWYRNWSGAIRNKVFYEKQGTAAGVIVADDSSDPGLLHVDPVGIDADHLAISKPADASDIVYVRTRDFVVVDVLRASDSGVSYGKFQACDLPELKRSSSGRLVPIAVRVAALLIIALIAFKGLQAIFFPPDLLDRASVDQIVAALRVKSPKLGPAQIDQFIQSLRDARGDPSFQRAVEEAKKGNTRVAEGIWRQIYESKGREQRQAQKDRAEAARNLAASAVINNVAEGMEWFRKATALDPDDMRGWFGLGSAALLAGSSEEAARAFDRQLSLARSAHDDRELALGLTGRGQILAALGDQAGALAAYRESRNTIERIVKQNPDDTLWQRFLAFMHDAIGDVLSSQSHQPEALASFRDALAIRERLAKAEPGNTDWQFDLSLSYGNIGNMLAKQGKSEEALASFRAGFDIADRLTRSEPDNPLWQRALLICHNNTGDLLSAQGHLPEALVSYQAGAAIAERLAKADPANMMWQRDLSLSDDKIGQVLIAQNHLPEALKVYRDSFAIRDRLAKSDPGNTQWQRDLSISYNKIGDALNLQSNGAEALASFRDGLAIAERLAKAQPDEVESQRDLCISHTKIGGVLMNLGSFPEAVSSHHACLAIMERLVKLDPSNLQWQHDLALTNSLIGSALAAQDRGEDGLPYFRTAVEICERLVKADPGTVQWQFELATYLSVVGELSDPPEARAAFTRAMSILEPLARNRQLNPMQLQMQDTIRETLAKMQ